MSDYRLLIVEDDQDINEMLSSYLVTEGYEIDSAYNGQEALNKFKDNTYDLIILDLMLPIISGLDVLKSVRKTSQLPVIILSAKDKDVDMAIGLSIGADDYVAKPFSMIEVVARIKAALRRATTYQHSNASGKEDRGPLKVHDLSIDEQSFTVTKRDLPIKLTQKEFKILLLFASHPNQVFTKAKLYESVWEEAYYGDDNVINVHMRRLREKIEDDPSSPVYIKTLWGGIGYKLGDV